MNRYASHNSCRIRPVKANRWGGALGASLGALGLKLRDTYGLAAKPPNGVFTKDIDMMNLFRNTKAGETLGKMHGDVKQAADSIKIVGEEIGDDFQGSGLSRKTPATGDMERA